jgi:hypothetical protein
MIRAIQAGVTNFDGMKLLDRISTAMNAPAMSPSRRQKRVEYKSTPYDDENNGSTGERQMTESAILLS